MMLNSDDAIFSIALFQIIYLKSGGRFIHINWITPAVDDTHRSAAVSMAKVTALAAMMLLAAVLVGASMQPAAGKCHC